jgi:hypothetical protein
MQPNTCLLHAFGLATEGLPASLMRTQLPETNQARKEPGVVNKARARKKYNKTHKTNDFWSKRWDRPLGGQVQEIETL